MSLAILSHHGVRRIKHTGRKRKGVDEYAAENQADFTPKSIIRDGQNIRVLVCRFCCQSIGARSDRIKEHLASKRHQKLKLEAASRDPKNVNEFLPTGSLQIAQGQESVRMSDVEECQRRLLATEMGNGKLVTNIPQSVIQEILNSPVSQSCNRDTTGGGGLQQNVGIGRNTSENCISGYGSSSPPEKETEQFFRVKWEKFDSNIRSMFSKFRNQEKFVDTTLWCQGKTIKCHKLILASSSLHFEKLLTEETTSHPIVFFGDKQFWEIQAIVEFIYRGEVKIPEKKLHQFLNAAQSLKIKGLCTLVDKMETSDEVTARNGGDKGVLGKVDISGSVTDVQQPDAADCRNNDSGHFTLHNAQAFNITPVSDMATASIMNTNSGYVSGWRTNELSIIDLPHSKMTGPVSLHCTTPLSTPLATPARLLPQYSNGREGRGIGCDMYEAATIKRRRNPTQGSISKTSDIVPSILISTIIDPTTEGTNAAAEDALVAHQLQNDIVNHESNLQQDLRQLRDNHDCTYHGVDNYGYNFDCFNYDALNKHSEVNVNVANEGALSFEINNYLPAVGKKLKKTNTIINPVESESIIQNAQADAGKR